MKPERMYSLMTGAACVVFSSSVFAENCQVHTRGPGSQIVFCIEYDAMMSAYFRDRNNGRKICKTLGDGDLETGERTKGSFHRGKCPTGHVALRCGTLEENGTYGMVWVFYAPHVGAGRARRECQAKGGTVLP